MKTETKHDSIYSNPIDKISDFSFDETVAEVFPDMIRRSVPGYSTIITAIGLLSNRYAQANSYCYDLGCSLGAASLAMRRKINKSDCRIIAVDNSIAMIQSCRQHLVKDKANIPVDLICADILDIRIHLASVVVLNFTLQFIDIKNRFSFVKRIYQGLSPGGILILSEKIGFSDQRQAQLQMEMHHAFKKDHGYSNLEISQKRTALERVLLPETLSKHKQRLNDVGFRSVETWFQYFNFVSMIAMK